MLTKSRLAVALSKLKGFSVHNILSEQYSTDSESAAEVVWSAYMLNDIAGKIIADLGCGTGVLGVGCLLLSAKKVHFVDNDGNALKAAAGNLIGFSSDRYEMHQSDVGSINLKAEVVVQNPPFGTKREHADRDFLLKAFSVANIIYSVHKQTSTRFVERLGSDSGFKVTHIFPLRLQIRQLHSFHRRRIYRVQAACYRLQKL